MSNRNHIPDTPPAQGARRRRSDRHASKRRRTPAPPRPPAGSPAGDAPPRRRRSQGAAPRTKRNIPWLRVGIGAFGVLAVALAAVWAVTTFAGDGDGDGDVVAAPTDLPDTVTGDPQPTLVLATFDETAPTGAQLVMLLAVEPATGQGTIVLVPAGVVADVPGEGIGRLGDTFRDGQAPLLELTLSNLMGLDLDGGAAISVQGWSSLVTRLGGLTLDVPEQLVAVDDSGQRAVRFQPGVQPLDGPRVAEYLMFLEPNESELQRLPRVQLVLEALLDHVAADPAVLDLVFDDGAPMVDVPDVDAFRFLLEALAAAHDDDQLDVRTLPVTTIGSGDDTSYRVVADRLAQLAEDRFAASRPSGQGDVGRRLQVLNGNGIPGIGSRVAEALQPGGFRLVETGNANSFDVPATRVIVYDDSPEQLTIAREVTELLGVGTIEVSENPTSVVDVTIIVGADYQG